MDQVGRYTILERLGRDALGDLLRARDVRLGRTVALRFVSPAIVEDPSRRAALLADAEAARALSHPHVSTLFDAGEVDGHVFLAHEFVAGRPLAAQLAGVPLGAGRVIEIAVQIAGGLAEGHARGLVHGAMGPAAVFITDKEKAKIVDFGLSAWTDEGRARLKVAEALDRGARVAVPDAAALASRMAPEQILTGRADARSDVFSLGVLVFEMATGTNPFFHPAADRAALDVLCVQPPPPSTIHRSLPGGLDAILARAMEKSPQARYASAGEMLALLRGLSAGPGASGFSLRFR
jgi:serine/threonine-protein kinase